MDHTGHSQLEQIEKLDAYRIVDHREIKEIQSEGVILEHIKTGARLFLISNDYERSEEHTSELHSH